jgi:hypothetical protein
MYYVEEATALAVIPRNGVVVGAVLLLTEGEVWARNGRDQGSQTSPMATARPDARMDISRDDLGVEVV